MAGTRRETRDYARKLTAISLAGDQVSPERVEAVLEVLRRSPPRRHRQVLREYARLIEREICRRQAVVEHAGPLGQEILSTIGNAMSARYGRAIEAVAQENPALIAGLRVQVADDVYDSSVRSRLDRLAATA